MDSANTRLYSILGIEPDADDVSIRRAFKQRALEHHPDRNPGDPAAAERFQAVREAYEVLIDPARRALYEEFGADSLKKGFDPVKTREERQRAEEEAKRRAQAAKAAPTTTAPPRTGQGGPAVKPVWEITVPIGARMARMGGLLSTRVNRPVTCPTCDGSGRGSLLCKSCGGDGKTIGKRHEACVACHQVGLVSEWVRCRPCSGTGVRARKDCRECGGAGKVARRIACEKCAGRGGIVVKFPQQCGDCNGSGRKPCKKCEGRGRVQKAVGLKLRVPKGAEGDTQYRYADAGFSSGSDLLVTFEILARAPARRRRRRW